MRILFVAPWIPSPVRPRSLGLLRILAQDCQVMFLGLARHEREAGLVDDLPVVDAVTVRNPVLGSGWRAIRSFGEGGSLQTGYADVPEFRRQLERLVRQWSPDVAHLNVFRTAHLLPELTDTRVVLDLDEFRSAYYATLATTSTSVRWRAVGHLEGPRMARAEKEVSRSRACVLVSSPADLFGSNTVLVRSPCDFEPTDNEARDPIVLFVGRLHYRPNVEGIRWFCTDCWPAIASEHPQAILRIVGESPPRAIRSLAGAGIEVVPNVSDMRPYYRQAMIAIVPVAAGTGVQMKLVQALASGVPAVSFPGVLSRAGLRSGQGALSADSPSEWVLRLSELLGDANLRSRLAAFGTAWAQAHHRSGQVRESLLEAYARLDVVA